MVIPKGEMKACFGGGHSFTSLGDTRAFLEICLWEDGNELQI